MPLPVWASECSIERVVDAAVLASTNVFDVKSEERRS